VLAQLGASSCTWISVKQNALCELCNHHCCCFIHYFNWKFETSFFCEGWIVLNLFLNSEQKWASFSYKIVLKKSVTQQVERFRKKHNIFSTKLLVYFIFECRKYLTWNKKLKNRVVITTTGLIRMLPLVQVNLNKQTNQQFFCNLLLFKIWRK